MATRHSNNARMRASAQMWTSTGRVRAAFLAVVAVAALFNVGPASATSLSASLSQCTNGSVGTPLVLEQCAGSSGGGAVSILNGQSGGTYANWVSGNSNGSKSHWREGEFIAYRAQVTAPP